MAKERNDNPNKGSNTEKRGHEHFEKGRPLGKLNESKLPDFKHTPPPPPPPKKDGGNSGGNEK